MKVESDINKPKKKKIVLSFQCMFRQFPLSYIWYHIPISSFSFYSTHMRNRLSLCASNVCTFFSLELMEKVLKNWIRKVLKEPHLVDFQILYDFEELRKSILKTEKTLRYFYLPTEICMHFRLCNVSMYTTSFQI